MVLFVYLAIAALAVAGLAALGRKPPMTREEYDDRLGRGAGPGNAISRGMGEGLLELQGILEPGREQVRKVREEKEDARDASGDPPEPGAILE
ncbi:MAG: hypothetical protein HY049_14185 [Acidobacteria bacterium]|nr:hypothetical protein [Acidobacteriota bacterium]